MLFQKLILFDDDIKESVKAANVQKCNFSQFWTPFFQNFVGQHGPRPHLEGLKKLFSSLCGTKKFFRIDFPPKQRILDGILFLW